ncbi:hypothetical protein [Paraburkholderia saeva]|uniref:Uncharacterized protein n=1 Tax=Paraburkholderia saeva TaxID=2777537 RepID=A0A9N8RU00_9BURK|nr:hypothetical protein [Paraburkholderia saeva]CAG4889818.1 hypothetical protein LMG31841_00903 [Paraburkholderia saeva]
MANDNPKPGENDEEAALDALAAVFAVFPERTLTKTMTEWLSGAALPREIRARLGRWADQMRKRRVPDGVDKVGHGLAIYMARQIAEGADLRKSYAVKVQNRRSERPRHVEIANQVYQRVCQGMTTKAAAEQVAPLYNLAPLTVRNIYRKHAQQIRDELGK